MASPQLPCTLPPPQNSPLKYHLLYARIQTDLELSEKETTKAQSELSTLLVTALNAASKFEYGRGQVGLLEFAQRFPAEQLNDALRETDAKPVSGATLSRLVSLINQRKLFGETGEDIISLDNCIFEVFDPLLENFIILVNRDSPIPTEATIRIRANLIQDLFNYEDPKPMVLATAPAGSSKALYCDDVPLSSRSKETANPEMASSQQEQVGSRGARTRARGRENGRFRGNGRQEGQSRNGAYKREVNQEENGALSGSEGGGSSRVTVFNKKYERANDAGSGGEGGARGGRRGRGRGRGRPRNRRRNRRRRSNASGSASDGESDGPNSAYPAKYPPLTRAQIYLFKDIIKALRDETLLREIDRESRRLKRLLESRHPENPSAWLQLRLLKSIWSKVVASVMSPQALSPQAAASSPDPIYLVAKYQQLYHLCVCVRYLGTLSRASTYLDAVLLYDLFNYIHGKIMSVFYLLEDLRIPTRCICGICGVDSTAIILARNAFRDKQVVTGGAAGTSRPETETQEIADTPEQVKEEEEQVKDKEETMVVEETLETVETVQVASEIEEEMATCEESQ